MRVLHLVGSPVSEAWAELSRLYARGCLDALRGRHEAVVAHVEPGGTWRFGSSLDDLREAVTLPEALAAIVASGCDVAVPQLFCLPGMTTYRALLEACGVAYVGNRPDVMALGAHKPRARAVVAAAGVAVPSGVTLRRRDTVPAFDLPVVVKPADADNSAGVTLVQSPGGLTAALESAWAESPEALVETYVPLGREVRCGVVERAGVLEVLPLEEYAVDAESKPVRLPVDKLARDDAGELGLVAKDAEHAWLVDAADPVNATVGELALDAFRALGCRHYGLFDVRIDPAGRPWFLEASLYCSFSPASVLAVMAGGAGTPVADLFDDLASGPSGVAGVAGVG